MIDELEKENLINNKKLEVKNTVFIYKEKIEKLESYNLNKYILINIIISVILGLISYFTSFLEIPTFLFVLSIVTLIALILFIVYKNITIKKLKNKIRNLELFFKEIDIDK